MVGVPPLGDAATTVDAVLDQVVRDEMMIVVRDVMTTAVRDVMTTVVRDVMTTAPILEPMRNEKR